MNSPVVATSFDFQVETLIRRGYPALAGQSEREFLELFQPLRAQSPAGEGQDRAAIVVKSSLVAPVAQMARTELPGGTGVVDLTPLAAEDFAPLAGVEIPVGDVYVATGIETGEEYLNVTPEAALRDILARGRSPLTIEEGIAVITHFPALLRKNACFSLPGSRAGDQRVPAIWISGRRPRLGWCWDRNPHTWLGAASCHSRLGAN